nr:reverse transcriptase domain-containing protein [Tanacetum cinerariifolium]
MRTRRSYFPLTSTIPRRSRKETTNVVEPEFRTIVEMADNHTMVLMLQAPIEGYEDAIVVPQINANNFELEQTLINLLQSNQFTGRQDPHNHLRFFNKVTSTFRRPKVPNTTIKLLLFPFSLEGEVRIWLDKEPSRSILTWEDLVLKFINQFFPPSKPNETFNEVWERFKDLLRQCPHHGFSELHQLDTFYNALNPNDQDALDSAAGGNFLDKIPRECLSIIESKSKVRYSRSRVTDVRANTNAPLSSSSPSNSFDLQQIAASLEDKLDIRMNRFEKSLNDMKNYFVTPTAPIKAVEEVCVTCGANHDFVVLDFIADPRVPLILGRPFLKIDNFLNDDSIPFGVEDSPFNMDEDILFLKSFLREDPIPPHLIISDQTKLPIEEPKHSFKMGHEHFTTNLSDYLDEFYGPFIPIHILEEEIIRREHADYINRMEMLFTIIRQPHPSTYANTNIESFFSLPIPIQESDSHQEEIDVVSITNDVLPPSVDNDDSDEEVDAIDVLRIDNFI